MIAADRRLDGTGLLILMVLSSGCATVAQPTPAPAVAQPTPAPALAQPAPVPAVAPPSTPSLSSFIEKEISRIPFGHAVWGIHVEDGDGTLLYSHQGDRLMIPASNRKLFTAALNEACFALDSTIPTELWIDGEIEQGTLEGDVVIKGYGNPAFIGRYDEASKDAALLPFFAALEEAGIRRIAGDVIGDGSAFDRDVFHGSWQLEDVGTSDQTPIDALSFNENVAGLFFTLPTCGEDEAAWSDPWFVPARADLECGEARSLRYFSTAENEVGVEGSVSAPIADTEVELVSIRDASLYAAQGLHAELTRRGIVIRGDARAGIAPSSAVKIATIDSPILAELLSTMMKASQNLYADALFKRMGGSPATWEGALSVERSFLVDEVGISGEEFSFADGSGLSLRNFVTPRAVVKLVRWLHAPPRAGANRVIFTTPGESGTLRTRLGDLEDRVRGKTGTLTGVSALSGWIEGEDGGVRYFSIIVNHYAASARAAREVTDAIVNEIARF